MKNDIQSIVDEHMQKLNQLKAELDVRMKKVAEEIKNTDDKEIIKDKLDKLSELMENFKLNVKNLDKETLASAEGCRKKEDGDEIDEIKKALLQDN